MLRGGVLRSMTEARESSALFEIGKGLAKNDFLDGVFLGQRKDILFHPFVQITAHV